MLMTGLRCIGFGLCPLLVVLFACEMSNLEGMSRIGRISDEAAGRLVAFYVFKLPAGLLVPLAGLPGILLMAVLQAASVIYIIRCQRIMSAWRAGNIEKDAGR